MPEDFLTNILADIALPVQKFSSSDDTILVYKHLLDIIDIFMQCPTILQGDRNKSEGLIRSLDSQYQPHDLKKYNRIDRLLQMCHHRILEKFKDFRVAFRRFDKNFDGSLNFREIITGFNEIGIQLNLPDYRLIFDKIDYDQAGEVDFFKFCLLDYDKAALREKLISDYENDLMTKESSSVYSHNIRFERKTKSVSGDDNGEYVGHSENLFHARFRDGKIPKNKDPKGFTADVQESTQAKMYLSHKRKMEDAYNGLKVAHDLPVEHIYGIK